MVRIYQRGKKRTYWIDYIFEGKRVQHSLKIKNKAAAEKNLVEARNAIDRGEQPFIGRKVKLGELLEDYMVYCEDVCLNDPKTLRDKRRYVGRYFRILGGDKKVATITRADIEKYMSQRRKESGSVILPNREYQTLRHFFEYAKNNCGVIRKNCCAGIKKFPGEERFRKPIRTLKPGEINEWLVLVGEFDSLLYDLSVVAIFTGQRAGDILTIKGSDVQRGVWYCRQSKKAGKLNPVKIIGPAAPVIENRKLQYGDGYLFPGKTPGTHRTTYRRRFNRAKKYLGLNFAFKDFRHTYATLLIESNVPITDVKKMLGHSRLSTTERYIKTSDEAVNRALDQLERRIQDEGYLDTD